MDPQEVQEWTPLIEKVARSVSHDFPGVDYDDLHQDLWVFVLDATTVLSPADAGAARALYRQARIKAWEHRRWQLAQTDQYQYTRHDVIFLLQTVFNPEEWEDAWVPDDAVSLMPWSDPVELSCDVSRAVDSLSDSDQFKLRSAFYYGNEVRGLQGAIDRVVGALNGGGA